MGDLNLSAAACAWFLLGAFVLAGMAHQPYLESASAVAQLIRSAVTEG